MAKGGAPMLENPVNGPNADPIFRESFSRFCALAAVCFIAITALAPLSGPLSFEALVAGCFATFALMLSPRPQLERIVAMMGLVALFASLPLSSQLGALSLSPVSGPVLLLAFLLAAIALRSTAREAGNIALAVGLILTLFAALAMSFGLPFIDQPVSSAEMLLSCAIAIGVTIRFADLGWVSVLNSKGTFARRLRWQCLAAIVVPWMFGMILYRGFGVTERAFAVEMLMIGTTIVGLFAAIYFFGIGAMREEQKRASNLQELRDAAMSDPLTGLPNRAGISSCLDRVWKDYRTLGRNSAVIIFDLDHFKAINDTFGHDSGDLVLRLIGSAVKPLMRSDDVIGRWGGEEFLCVLPGAETKQLKLVAERLRSAIEGLSDPVSRSLGADCPISASFGVAQFARTDAEVGEAIARADRALYESKSAGRNRVSMGGAISLVSETRNAWIA